MHRATGRSDSMQGKSLLVWLGLPCLVLAISLTATILAWRSIENEIRTRGEARLHTISDDIAQRLIDRLQENETILLGGAALFNVQGETLTRQHWRTYAASLRLESTNPGILGFGYSIWLPAAQTPALIQAVRADGYPSFALFPSGDRPDYTAIIWLEPFNAMNQRAFGYDMYAEPVRRAAMDRTRDSGQTSVTGQVILKQEGEREVQNGILMYVPSYRASMPLETVQQRRAALRGFVYSPIRMNDLVAGALGNIPGEIDFSIHNHQQSDGDTLLYSSAQHHRHDASAATSSRFRTSKTIDIYGVSWQLCFASLPVFEQDYSRQQSLFLLLAGTVISFGLALVTYQQGRTRQQALIIAAQMREQLVAQQKFALHLQLSPLAVIECDEQGRITAWNPAAQTIFGYAPHDAVGRPIAMLMVGEQRQQMEHFLTRREPGKATWKNLTKEGEAIDGEWFTITLIDQSGQVLGLVALVQDVTERNKNEQALRCERNLLQTVMDGAKNSHLVYLDRDFNFVRVNRAYAETCGYTPEAMIGKNHFALYPHAENEALFRQVRDSGQPLEVQDKPFEFPDQPERGLTWWNWTLTPVFDECGAVNGLVFALHEITKRKQLELALQASEAQFRLLFEEHGSTMLLIDPLDGRILRANKAAIDFYGYGKDQLQSMTIGQINCLPWENQVKLLKQISLAQLNEFSVPHRLADNSLRTVEVHTAPIAFKGKTVIFSIIHDITARIQAEEDRRSLEAQNIQLQKAESLARMAGAIAHHFNNKLQGVMMSLEMVRDLLAVTPTSEHQQLDRLSASALKSAERAAEVSKLLLTYLGSAPCEFTVLDLGTLCRDYQPILRASMPEGIDLRIGALPLGMMVRANAGQLQQILTNLITNAWEACTGGQGPVTLEIASADGSALPAQHRFPLDFRAVSARYVCIQVRDNGAGIREEEIERLFDPFFSSKFTGRGMGLSAVLGIVRAHKGAIVVESVEGQGSSFTVYLPLVQVDGLQKPPAAAVAMPQTTSGTILMVEDEIVTRKLASEMLARLGYTVLEAQDGVQALDIFAEHRDSIVLVICDVVMPRMNGWETVAAIREHAPHLPIILASGYNEAQVMDGRIQDASLSFLEKPYRFNRLRERIAEMLHKPTVH